MAADLPARTAPPVFAPLPVPFSWTGFYVGGNVGYGLGLGSRETAIVGLPANANAPGSGFVNTNPLLQGTGTPVNVLFLPTTYNAGRGAAPASGFVGGGQIGYNYQVTPGSGLVIGVEADAQYADLAARNRNADVAATLPVGLGAPLFTPGVAIDRKDEPGVIAEGGLKTVTFLQGRYNAGVEWFGTVRGRLGYAFDRVLVYGTGGFAYGQGRRDPLALSGDGIRTGWTAGGGLEYALPLDTWLNVFHASAVTVKIEGLYVRLDRDRKASVPYAFDQSGNVYYAPASAVAGLRRSDDFAVVRVGLNYRF